MGTNSKAKKREYNKLYMRKYREKNKEQIREYNRKYKEKNKEHLREYMQKYMNDYYSDHQKEMYQSHKKYMEKFRGYYLYIIVDKENIIKYVGSTTNIKRRLYSHLTCNSNIKNHMKQEEWEYIKYLDISNLVENENELRLLENELIELYQPQWNKTKNIVKEIEEERKLELICSIHNLENVWEIYAENV